ncbi:hypothetical protein [Roseitranquillus sediminis]|nr:hypothetical protein [Roseitranquillus sediminis]MBM9593102.1 hypothetical protein [Roseitranquillus sediminis]
MPKQAYLILALALALTLAACAAPNRYPVSGEECGPNDPVGEMHRSTAPT